MDLMTWEDISSLEKMTRSNIIPKNYQTVWHLLYMIFWFQIVRRKFTEFLENYYCTKKPIICTTSCLWRALDTLLFCRLAFPHLSKIQISLETSGWWDFGEDISQDLVFLYDAWVKFEVYLCWFLLLYMESLLARKKLSCLFCKTA